VIRGDESRTKFAITVIEHRVDAVSTSASAWP
jgi:hypothetical protein